MDDRQLLLYLDELMYLGHELETVIYEAFKDVNRKYAKQEEYSMDKMYEKLRYLIDETERLHRIKEKK